MAEHIEIEHDSHPSSDRLRIQRLEFAVLVQMEALSKQKGEIAELKRCCDQIKSWGHAEVAWTTEVTALFRAIDLNTLQDHFPGGGGTNPPQTPPDWPI